MKKNIGFTLVELLIVIALIAILSVAVLATINPIEQANKALDASVQNDAAEVLNAYERYFANSQSYPWMRYIDADDGGQLTTDSAVFLESTDGGFGICYLDSGDVNTAASDTGVCNIDPDLGVGALIESDELKPSFANKSAFQLVDANPINGLWTVKSQNGSIHVCFVPRAKSNRNNTDRLRCIDDGTGGNNIGIYRANEGGVCTSSEVEDWSQPVMGEYRMFICIP